MQISLKQMRYAVAVARTGHFGRAAETCAVTQPALSQQILALEALCGTPLFDRLKTGVRLTPFGHEFVLLAEQTLRSAEALDAFALRHADRPDRPLRFGLIPTVAPYLLPEVFPLLGQSMPDLRFAISEAQTEPLLSGVQDGRLDLALIATEPPPGGPRLVVQPLFDDHFVLATPHDETLQLPVSLNTIASERMLLLDEGHCFRDQAIAACGLPGRGKNTFAATSLSTIVEFVASGQGVTLLPQIALRKESANPRIAIHPLNDATASRKLRLVWREATPFSKTFNAIADQIRQLRPAT